MYECNNRKFRSLKQAEIYADRYFKAHKVVLGIFYKE